MTRKHLATSVLAWLALAFLTIPTLGADTKTIPQRANIEAKYKWKLEDIYPDPAGWEKDFNALKGSLHRLEPYKGHLGDSPEKLLSCLKLVDSLSLLSDNLSVYASLKQSEDTRLTQSQEMRDRISGLRSQFGQALSFLEPEILALGKGKALGMIRSETGLVIYRFYILDLFRQHEHILSDKEEAILALSWPVAYSPRRIFSMIDDADISYGMVKDQNGQEIMLTKERYSKILESKDRALRREANRARNQAYLRYLNTLAATLGASLKKDLFFMKARGYPSTLAMSLEEDSIPPAVVTNLISTVNSNLAPLHKWTALRKRILGYDTLYAYDLFVPLGSEERRDYPYEEAKAIAREGLRQLGRDYVTTFQRGLEEGWIDVYETQGKSSGGFQTATYSTHPYILLNYNNTLENLFTLTHEMGHAMHTYYTNRSEPYISSGHSTFTAEVASTTNEAVLMKYLLAKAKTKSEKMDLLNHYIEQIIGTFYTQVMFTEFELAIHERVEKGQATSPDYFRRTYREIYQRYWGPELVVDSLNDLGGLRIGHFYSPYYNYKYATSYAAAQMLSQELVEGKKGAVEKYRRFLSTGSSNYPLNILKLAGVDMTTPEPFQRTTRLFGELVDEMERLLDEKE